MRLFVSWQRAAAADNVDGFVHRILVRRYLDERRLRWSRVRLGPVPEQPATADHAYDDRDELLTALRSLPKGQRAVVVLRFLNDLSVEATADALGCSVGNVKSQCARGLATLRDSLGAERRLNSRSTA
jgi:RNA polymerase sigma factor (sigma-70 family)